MKQYLKNDYKAKSKPWVGEDHRGNILKILELIPNDDSG